jgi:hypothetical protein
LKQKYFYLHIPKTAGTTFNDFLKRAFSSKETLFHIESKLEKIENQSVLAGHIILPRAQKIIPNFENYIKLTVLRDPLSQVSSHLRYVKKLGEPSELKRLEGHTDSIKIIVSFLGTIDFSKVEDINRLIYWLEENNYVLFHNCQMQYLIGSRFIVNETDIERAKQVIDTIEYVGITERLNEYMEFLSQEFGIRGPVKNKKLNITSETYGLDIKNPDIIKALEPFIAYDKVIYQYTKEKFERDIGSFLENKKYKKHNYFDRIYKLLFK